MFICPKCGASTAGELERCVTSRRADCPFELSPGQEESHLLFGTATLFLGLVTSVGISAVLFVSPSRAEGIEAVVQALALICIYTFVYSISGIFMALGLFALLHRRLDLREVEGGRVAQVVSLLGRTLSFQVVDVEEPLTTVEPASSQPVPASVLALRDVVEGADQAGRTSSFAQRMERVGKTADRIAEECLEVALVSLVAHGAVRVRPARVRVVWPFLSRSPVADMRIHLFEAGPEPAPDGALETLLLEQIRAWPESEQADYPFATTRELVETFKDSEGDFSAHRIVRAVEDDGVARGWFDRRPRLSVKRLLPEPSRSGSAHGPELARDWRWILEELRGREPAVLRDVRREIDSVIDRSGKAHANDLDRAQSRLRTALAKRLVGVSALAATIVYALSRII